MRLAAIDIGSNAIRLLIVDVVPTTNKQFEYNKINLIRVPVRLGTDVFKTGVISLKKIQSMIATMNAFKYLMKVHDVVHYKAAATSALRDSANGPQVIQKIKAATDIKIDIISGTEEADIIYENHFAENLRKDTAHLYIDVGGGSTELTLFLNNIVLDRASFNIGTVRLLSKKVSKTTWKELQAYTEKITMPFKKIDAIGSGGNINKVFTMSHTKEDEPLNIKTLETYYKELAPLTVKQRIHDFKLKEDRADVIVHALNIYTNVMQWAGIQNIYVPKIGMADGLIKLLHQNILAKKK